MNLLPIGVTLFVMMLLLLLLVRSFFVKSGNTNDFDHTLHDGGDNAVQQHLIASSGHDTAVHHHVQNHDGGDRGARDMSYDHHAGHDGGGSHSRTGGE